MPGSRDHLLQQLKVFHSERRDAIVSRLRDFREVPPSEYFYELAYCLLTPQTSAAHAEQVVAILQKVRFRETGVDPAPFLREPSTYVRFHQTKARHLLKLRFDIGSILQQMALETDPFEMREWLVQNVMGLGYKEATHFLRNVGRNGGLTILDRHILRNLKRYGAIRSLPPSLPRKKYLAIERNFVRFSDRIGIPVDELDLLFWSMETGSIRK